MSEVKNIPILRFSGYNDGWESYCLNEVTKVYDGTHQTPKYVEDGVPFYSVETVTSNDFSNTKFVSQKVYEKEIKRVKIESGDVLMTRIGDIGTSKLITWNIPCSFYVSLALIKGFDDCTSGFLKYFFDSNYFQSQLWQKTLHVAYPKKINLGELNTCKILKPSLPEQQKIADFLTAVDKRIELLEKKKTILETYKKGVMKKIFNQEIRFKDEKGNDFPDWEEKRLGEIGQIVTGKTPSTTNNSYWDGPIQFITPTDIKDGFKYQEFTSRSVTEFKGIKILPIDSIVYTCIASIGKMSITKKPSVTNQQINSIIPFEENTEFIYYSLQYLTPRIQSLKSTTTLPIINKTEFSGFNIHYPSMSEQKKISKFLSSIDNQIELLETQIDKSKIWKKGLLQKMFI